MGIWATDELVVEKEQKAKLNCCFQSRTIAKYIQRYVERSFVLVNSSSSTTIAAPPPPYPIPSHPARATDLAK